MEQIVEEGDKEAYMLISNCAIDVATGGLFNCLVGTKSISLTSETTRAVGRQASKEITRNGMSEVAKELIVNGKVVSDMQRVCEFANNFKDDGLTFSELSEQIKHKIHLDKGVDYLESCEVCNEKNRELKKYTQVLILSIVTF